MQKRDISVKEENWRGRYQSRRASRSTTDTIKSGESEQGSGAENEKLLSGKFPEDELIVGRQRT